MVDYGTKTVPLQLNAITFLCAALVSPDTNSADFSYSDQRVVRTSANDRTPNRIPGQGGSSINGPARTNVRSRIEGIRVLQGNGHVSGAVVGNYFGTQRQNNTRYWFSSPVHFNFVSNSPNGLTSNTVVKIRFDVKTYSTYYYNQFYCDVNGRDTGFNPESNFTRTNCSITSPEFQVSINIRYKYDLTPEVDLSGQTAIEPGGTATVKNTVTKSEDSTDTKKTDWRLTRLMYGPGQTLSNNDLKARDSEDDPCAAFTSSGRSECGIPEGQQNEDKIFTETSTTYDPQYSYTAGDLPAGTKVCFVASVSQPTQSDDPKWRHSDMQCLIVSKKPKVQVHGGDIRVGGKIDVSTSYVKSGASEKYFGSWVEYGALSVGLNSNFASGSALADGTTRPVANWHALTFANIDNSGSASYGNYTLPATAKLADQFSGVDPDGTASANLGSLSSGTYRATNLTINASTVGQSGGKGKSIIIVASGTVTIKGDIIYKGQGGSNNFTDIKQIPQVIIIAKNINITNAPKVINAWLLTSGSNGSINTCSSVAVSAPLTASVCSNELTINGAVATNHLYLRRTAGSEGISRVQDPAEVFNLRADAYLWAQGQANEDGKAQTVYTKELPPRF